MHLVIQLHQGETCEFQTRDNDAIIEPAIACDIRDCCKPGECEEACRYLLTVHDPEFRIVKKCEDGQFRDVTATPYDKRQLCESIYFDSDVDFTDEVTANLYLVWEACSQYVENERTQNDDS